MSKKSRTPRDQRGELAYFVTAQMLEADDKRRVLKLRAEKKSKMGVNRG